jgi:hypothetical protein
MPAPAVIVTTETSPPPRSNPTDTGPVFYAGRAERGPAATATVDALVAADDGLTSLAQWTAKYGGRVSGSYSYDWVETYFRNGGSKVYFARVLGDTPVLATQNLASTGTTLIVKADQYGAYFNTSHGISVTNGTDGSHRYVKLVAGSTHPTLAAGTVIDQTVNMASRDDAVGTAVLEDTSIPGATFSITAGGGSGLPTVAAAAAFGSGTDDFATADDSNVDRALDQLQPELGPGQLAATDWLGGASHAAVHGVLQAHGATDNRFAACDSSSATASKSTLLSEAGAIDAGVNSSYSMYVGTWVTVQPLTAGGQDRSVPGSALVCARLSDTDARFHPNRAAAGTKDGVGVASPFVTGVSSTFSRTPQGSSDADALSDAGVNLIVVKNGQVVVYDDVTLVSPTGSEQNYLHVPNARYRMWVVARATAIGDGAQFDQVNWDNIHQFGIDLTGILKQDFQRGILVPDRDDPREATAYNVDVVTPNDLDTMDAGEMNANIAVRPARSARIINITITSVSLTESVA